MKKEQIMEMLMTAVVAETGGQTEEPRFPYLLIPYNGDNVKFLRLTKSQAEFFDWMQGECMIDECDYELLPLAETGIDWQTP